MASGHAGVRRPSDNAHMARQIGADRREHRSADPPSPPSVLLVVEIGDLYLSPAFSALGIPHRDTLRDENSTNGAWVNGQSPTDGNERPARTIERRSFVDRFLAELRISPWDALSAHALDNRLSGDPKTLGELFHLDP